MSEAANHRLFVLLGAAGLLAVAVTADRLWDTGRRTGMPVEAPVAAEADGAGDGSTSAAASFDDFHDIDDRPLFSPSRQRVAASADGAGAPVGDAVSLGDTQLVGLVSSPGRHFAVVQRQSGQPSVRIEEGQDIGGWRLVEVSPREAVFEKDGSRRSLRLFHTGGAAAEAEQAGQRSIIPTDAMLGIGKPP